MQVEGQYQEDINAITHSPYYGCTVRVLSKARVSYEGVLDGISTNKDRIYLKNVRVNANITDSSNRNSSSDDLNKNITTDTLNAVMIDHLTNDIHTYEQVCLNVRDIQELRLIQLPSTFHESKAKLRAIDPCLVDIRLSSSDEYETKSNGSNTDHPPRAPIARQSRGESFGSNGDSALISSDSNDSSASFALRSDEKFADESNDESLDEQIQKFNQLTTASFNSKPVTLLAKKVLPKKIDRRTDLQSTAAINTNNNIRQTTPDNREITDRPIQINNHNTLKIGPAVSDNRKSSPIRVTITSTLNPNATPFYTQQRNIPAMQHSSFTFYERPRFRPRLQPVTSPDRSQSLPYGMNVVDNNNTNNNHHYQQQQNYPHSNQSYVSQRQMPVKKNFTQTSPQKTTKTRPIRTPPPTAKYRIHASTSMDKRFFSQPQYKGKTQNNPQYRQIISQTSGPTSNPPILTPPIGNTFSMSRNNPTRRSTASIRSTPSLPYQYGCSSDRNQMHTPLSFQESIGSHRSQRTVSGASSCSSLSVDIGPHSIVQLDSSSNIFPSFDEQYDFEKANEEFRRYLELEELVIRRPSSHCSNGSPSDDSTMQQQQQQAQTNLYKKEISFFDRISCTATTGTAVGYTEIDETEKNLETFGNDALLMASNLNDNEWQI
ncbi:unnamed protein product [Rotaria sp. Silwood2]|nr:unnamed protein product [Rotaria sp. Silwood2]CAF2506263.1 unnamed protein product [Rotaria sp. Silwood2]CAF2737847.1 unnamed protein product [Rotaria sp. Silwood2]CAF2905424.1 unnamed protein product [Rotaria sp. Silwood2]CAF3918756.1 unnamed protein product [Rotaria sp. Silwood2]